MSSSRCFRCWLALAAFSGAAWGAEPQTDATQAVDAETAAPAVVTSPAAQPPPVSESRATGVGTRGAADRLELDTTVVTGNRELPKVLYIVPWKKADLGELPGQPFNTLLDEVLTPVDRDVFRREVTYFEAVTEGADATQSTSQPQQ